MLVKRNDTSGTGHFLSAGCLFASAIVPSMSRQQFRRDEQAAMWYVVDHRIFCGRRAGRMQGALRQIIFPPSPLPIRNTKPAGLMRYCASFILKLPLVTLTGARIVSALG